MQRSTATAADEPAIQDIAHLMLTIVALPLPRDAKIAIQDYLNLLPSMVNHHRRAPRAYPPILRDRANNENTKHT